MQITNKTHIENVHVVVVSGIQARLVICDRLHGIHIVLLLLLLLLLLCVSAQFN